jgi:glycosyltransferase involved in cell wall biosynthesis
VPLDRVTAGYDLLVNASYRSHGANGARHGIYVVHFPDRPGADLRRWQRGLARSGTGLRRGAEVVVVDGFHEPDVIRWQQVRWTDGEGRMRVRPTAGRRSLTLHLGRFVPGGEVRHVEVDVDGVTVAEALLVPAASKREVIDPLTLEVPLPAGAVEVELVVRSEASRPADVVGGGDRRLLGVPVLGVTAGGPAGALLGRVSLLGSGLPGTRWLEGYDRVVANSAFTRRWIREWWSRDSEVLEPPVGLRAPGPKDPLILSVGRFFASGRGHSKKQVEMVQAFRRVHERAPGWELHLVGGCGPDDRSYLDAVRTAAAGLPVVVHVDASGAELESLYRRASIYWHATGLDEDVDVDPVRAEHFGITTVEAMSAGAVPVVMDVGGQPEIVRDGVDGLLFHDLDGLVGRTIGLVGDRRARAHLAQAAEARAERYGLEAFGARLERLVAGLEPSSTGG